MSFYKIKIVKQFSKKTIILRIKNNKNVVNNTENNIVIKQNALNTKIIKQNIENNTIINENMANNPVINENREKTINNYLFIGLIFCYNISVNKLYNLEYLNINKSYLHMTYLYLKSWKFIPFIKIDRKNINDKFQFKKYIKNKITEIYKFKKKNILKIKIINTNENSINYAIFLKNNKYLSDGMSSNCVKLNDYGWRTIFDKYKIKNIKIKQNINIYDLIKNNKNNFNFKMHLVYNNFNIITIEYKKIIELLFNYYNSFK